MTKAQKRRKARQDAKAQKRADKLLRQQGRQDAKLLRQQGRQGFKLDRNFSNNERRTLNTQQRQDTKETAYAMGIDPNQWIADSIGHTGDAVVGVFEAKADMATGGEGGWFGGLGGKVETPSGEYSMDTRGRGSNMGMLAIIGAVLLFMFEK